MKQTEDQDVPWDIYRLTSPSGKAYIGIAKIKIAGYGIRRRWKDHRSTAYRPSSKERNHPLYCAMRKYGHATFVVEHLYTAINKREADAVERGLIAQYGTLFPLGYNLTSGGGGSKGIKASIETRTKMSAVRRGRKNTPEHCANISAAKRGKLPFPEAAETLRKANLGRKLSDEHREKLRIATTGRKYTPEQNAALSEIIRNRVYDPDVRLRINAAISAARKGHKQSEDTIAKRVAKNMGQTRSTETLVRMTQGQRASYDSPQGIERRAKQSEARRQWWARKKAAHSIDA